MSDDPILAVLVRLETSVARLETGQESLRSDVAHLRTDLTHLATGQESLRSDVARVETGQQSLRSDFLAELGTVRGQILEKVEGLQDAVTAIRDDVGVNMGAVDQARRVNDNTREEMRGLNDVVNRMMRLILRLQADVDQLRWKDK